MASEWSYVVGAYALTWVVILGYALRLRYRLRRAAEELAMAQPSSPPKREA
ncbi:MAG TPA: CcmD family protein [Longimicrobiales bacterium]|nr:CcmD family protein [Longimicrobiales bacterium]